MPCLLPIAWSRPNGFAHLRIFGGHRRLEWRGGQAAYIAALFGLDRRLTRNEPRSSHRPDRRRRASRARTLAIGDKYPKRSHDPRRSDDEARFRSSDPDREPRQYDRLSVDRSFSATG